MFHIQHPYSKRDKRWANLYVLTHRGPTRQVRHRIGRKFCSSNEIFERDATRKVDSLLVSTLPHTCLAWRDKPLYGLLHTGGFMLTDYMDASCTVYWICRTVRGRETR